MNQQVKKLAIGTAIVLFVLGLISWLVAGQLVLAAGGVGFALILLFAASMSGKPASDS